MPRIEWDNSYSVQNDEIDAQHKKWFEMFNDLHETLLSREPKDYNSITENALQSMKDYALNHFGFEEEYMRSINYPDLEHHQAIHKQFAQKIDEYQNNFRAGRLLLNSEIIQVMKDWLRSHILEEDKKYCDFASSKK